MMSVCQSLTTVARVHSGANNSFTIQLAKKSKANGTVAEDLSSVIAVEFTIQDSTLVQERETDPVFLNWWNPELPKGEIAFNLGHWVIEQGLSAGTYQVERLRLYYPDSIGGIYWTLPGQFWIAVTD